MTQHVKILGVLHIILGCFGVLGAVIVFAVFGGLAGFFSGLSIPDANADVRTAAPFLGILGIGITAIILILSVPGIIIGIGLIQFRPWARIAGIVLSALDLLNVPFGTVVGIYGLWALLQPQTEALFTGRPLPPAYPVQPGPPRT